VTAVPETPKPPATPGPAPAKVQGGEFPWIIVVVLAAAGLLSFFFMRRKPGPRKK